jgi:hypothetical protein
MRDLRHWVVSAALAVALLAVVAAGLARTGASLVVADSGHAGAARIGSGVDRVACPLGCDADGDGLLDALLLPIVFVVIARLTPLGPGRQGEPCALVDRSIPPLPPPPRFRR